MDQKKIHMKSHMWNPIGIIHSPYATTDDTPIQGIFSPEGIGRIEVFPEYKEGLKDIETFSHLIIFTNLTGPVISN